jgi:prepilin-type processing-associated H-X9-DG protein
MEARQIWRTLPVVNRIEGHDEFRIAIKPKEKPSTSQAYQNYILYVNKKDSDIEVSNIQGLTFPENPAIANLSPADYGDNLIAGWGTNGANGVCCGSNPGYYATGKTMGVTDHDPIATPGKAQAARHTDGANWAFVDGHAKWLRGTNVNSLNGNPGGTQCPVTGC